MKINTRDNLKQIKTMRPKIKILKMLTNIKDYSD